MNDLSTDIRLNPVAAPRTPPLLFIGLLIVIVALSLLAAWIVNKPQIGILAAFVAGVGLAALLFYNFRLFLTFLFPIIYLYPNNNLYLALIILLTVSFAAERFASGRIWLSVPYGYRIIIILALGIAAVGRSFEPDIGRFFFQYSILLPLYVFIIIYNSQISTTDIHLHIRTAGLVMALIGFLSVGNYVMFGAYRQVINWGSINIASVIFGMLIPLTLAHIFDERQKSWQKLDAFIIAGLTVGLVLTQTRAILLATIVAILLLARRDRRILILFIPGLLLAVAMLPSVIGRMMMLFGVGVIPDWSAVGRIQIWKNSLMLLKDHWFWGLGVQNFYEVYNALFPYSLIGASHPHNIYLRMIFDYGFIAAVFFFSIIFSIIWRGYCRVGYLYKQGEISDGKLMSALNAALFVVLVGGLLDSCLTMVIALFFWTLCAFQVVLLKRTPPSLGVGSSSFALSLE